MGKTKYLKKVEELFEKSPVIDVASIKKIVGENNDYIHLLLYNLIKKGKIYRLTKGWYSKSNDPILVVYCFKPSYLGLQEALSIHNLWEQETNTIIITTKNVREEERKVLDSKVIVKRLPKKLFFGIEHIKYGETYTPVSDVEKTFLDLIYFNQPLDKELISNFKKRIKEERLKEYIDRFDPIVKERAVKLLGKSKLQIYQRLYK